MSTRCRLCNAQIVWIVTAAGKKMPCNMNFKTIVPDPEPTAPIVIVTPGGDTIRGRLALGQSEEGAVHGRESHFATCPFARTVRKGKE